MAGRREYLRDYHPTEDGGYEYRGVLWEWGPSGKEGFLRAAAPAALIGAAALLALGFLPRAATGSSFTILLPYAAAMIGAALAGAALVRAWREGDPMRDHAYRASMERLPLACVAGGIGAGLGAAGALIHALGEGRAAGALPWLACASLALACACFWRLRALAQAASIHPQGYAEGEDQDGS